MLLLALTAAHAAPETSEDPATEEEEEPRTVELSLPEDLGGTALDDLDEDARDEATSTPDALDLPLRLPRPPLRGRFAARPVLGASLLAADRAYWALRIGVAVDHRYWWLADRPIQLSGHTELQATAPIGAASGRRFVLSSTLGPWAGPVGLQVGPVLRSDRVAWKTPDLVLADTLAVGGRADLSLQAGAWRASLGMELAWLALGDRPPADPATARLPVLGDETAYRVGLGHQGDRWLVVVRGTWRETAIGAEIDAGLQLGLRLL